MSISRAWEAGIKNSKNKEQPLPEGNIPDQIQKQLDIILEKLDELDDRVRILEGLVGES